jgi:hypothetical protein
MKFRLLAAVVGIAMLTGAAQAQVGIYVSPLFSHISNSTVDNGVFSFLGSNTTSRLFKGVGMGVYDNLYHSPKIEAGPDVRLNILRGDGAQLTSFLVGGHVSYKTKNPAIKPYGLLGIGVGNSKAATNSLHISKFEYNIAGGVDYSFSSHVDWRVIEIGYGSVEAISTGLVSATGNTSSSRMINFSTGLVFRIH